MCGGQLDSVRAGSSPPVSPKAPMTVHANPHAANAAGVGATARLHSPTVPRAARKPSTGGARFDRGGGALDTGRRRLNGRHGDMRPQQAKQTNLANRVDNYDPVPAGSNPQAHKPRSPGPIPRHPTGTGSNRNRRTTWAAQGARGVENSIVKRKDSSGHPMSHTRPLGARNADGTTRTLYRVCERPATVHTGCTPRTAGGRVPAVERKPMSARAA